MLSGHRVGLDQTDEGKTSFSLPACSQTPYSHQRSFSEILKLPLLYTTAT